jgi:hypothetical protein
MNIMGSTLLWCWVGQWRGSINLDSGEYTSVEDDER